MLSKSFKPGKCKTSLKLAISRIKLLKNRRDIQVKQLKRELAQLLETGQEQTARIRVEHVIREEKTMSAYDLIEIYCELIVARMPIIESQKSCPIDLKEAISSVIFSSPRCADIPELTDARKQFVAKYGKEFATSALELRPDCGVNRMIVEKLSAKTPDTETKIKILIAIAKEHEIKWDSKALKELPKPEDQLNSSSSFTGANKMPMEPLNVKFSPNTSQTESASNVYQTDVSSKPTSFDSSSQANLRTTPLVPPLAPNEFRESDGKAGVLEVKDSYPREEAAFFKQPTWRMEFKDAASAAQVAAESAERASIAARAAAELASRGNISRQNTFDPNGSSLHGSGDKRPKRVVSSKLKGKINESVNMDHDKVKGFQGMKEEVHKLPRDELREEISHHSSTSDEGMEFSSQMDNVRKFDSFRRSFSRMETGNQKKHDEAGFTEKNVEVNYDRSASASSISTFDDDTIWIPPIDNHQPGNHDNLGHNIYEIDAGERLFRYDSKEHVSSDYPAAVFDEYDPEPADDKENLFDSFNKKRNDQLPFAPSTSSINSIIFSSSHHESHPVSVEKIPSSKFDDSLSVAFDDSDGHTSESDDDMSSFRQNGTTQNSSLQHEESDLGGDSHPREELQSLSSTKAKPLLGAEEKNHLQVSPPSVGAKDPEMPDELAGGGNFGLKFGRLTGGLRNRGYSHPPYAESSVVDSPVSSLETLGSTISSTNQIISPQDKPFGSSLIEDESLNPIMAGASTNLESEKAKGSLPEEYNKGSRSNKTFSTDRSEEDGDATGFSVKQSVSNQEKSRRYRGGNPNPSKNVPFDPSTNASEFSTVSEVINQKIYHDKPRTKAYKELSTRMSKADFDSDSDAEERDSQVNMKNQGNANSKTTFKFSRRTKDFTLKGRPNLPRSTGYSVMSNSETESRATRRSSASELPSQTVDKATVVQGKHNRKSSNPNSSAESMADFLVHEENKESTEGIPDPATTIINSGNSKPSDSGGGTKLQEAAYQKVSHVHPKLPDYETFASHFQSLRSNRRQL